MSQISAKQLIYTRVEEAYSPVPKSGYQTFYASPGLKQSIVDSIVKKISEFQPHSSDLKRWQCFFLDNYASAVITQTQLIDSDPEIIDKDSRPGILVAHCLILDSDDYRLAGCDPFRIIEQFKFVATAKEMVQRYNQNEGKESEARFDISEYRSYSIDSSWQEHAYQLALTAFPQFVKSKNSILLYGEYGEIYETLKAIFLYIPPSYRESLAFDTYIKGRQVLVGEFWAVGLPEWKTGYSLAINTSTKTFSRDPNNFEDLYLLWLQKKVPKDLDLGTILATQEISDSFYYKRPPNKDKITHMVLETFFEIHRQTISTRILTVTNQILGKNLSLLFIKFLEQNSSLFDLISIAATGLFPPDKLSLRMREWFVSFELDFGKITTEDWGVLTKFSISAKDNIIALWCAAFTSDKKLFQNAIRTLTAEEYDYALRLIAQPLKPLSIFVPNYVSRFVSALSEKLDLVKEDEYVEIINEIMICKGHRELDLIADFVFHLGNKGLTHLEKIIVKQPIPLQFRSSIEKRRAKLGQQYTIIDAILRRK